MAKRKSDLEKYFERIAKGKERASAKMLKLACKMLPRIRGGYKRWHFDIERAERAIAFIETFCKIPSGRIGQPFALEAYEKAIVECIFGFVDDDGFRQFQEVLVIIGRKNGKTSLGAAIELYMLLADGEGSPQVYNVASSKDQASLAYGAALKMVRQSKEISKHVRKGTVVERDSDGIICDANMGYISVLSSQTRHLDGLDVHFALIDELSAIVNRDVYDLVKQGMSARDQPLLMEITTNGFVRGGVFDAQYNYASDWLEGKIEADRFLAFVYELDSRDEWADEKCWRKANPGLGTVKKLSALRGFVQKAKDDPEFLPTVLTKDFNIPENIASAWLRFDEAVNEEVAGIDSMEFDYGIVGFDASDTTDLTAAKMLLMRKGDEHVYVRSMYWMPEAKVVEVEDAGKRTGCDNAPYRKWIDRGLMRTVPGNTVPKTVLIDWILEARDELGIYTFAVGYDRWGIDESVKRDLRSIVGESRCFDIAQGPKTFSDPMRRIKADYRAKRIVDDHNPVNEWCRMNVTVKTDTNGNIQPVKKLADPRNRIDGFMAELDAYTVLLNLYDDYLALV